MHEGLAELGITLSYTPADINLFMNIPWNLDGGLEWGQPLSKPGDYVVFRAEMDCVVGMSACPQDILAINAGKPVEAHFEVIG